MVKKFLATLTDSVGDDAKRRRLQFLIMFFLLMVVAALMTVVNIITGMRTLGWSTFIFALLCGLDVLLARRGSRGLWWAAVLFIPEFFALLIFFIVSGIPEGFSALWICMLPVFGVILYGRKRGTLISAVMFAVVVFFFDTPPGVGLLQYPYTTSFRLRFPMIYFSFYVISLFMETVRVITQAKLNDARKRYRYLYAHDALTGLYNRYGFNHFMEQSFAAGHPEGVALIIADIDHFKDVNDSYGHADGDLVLKAVADCLARCVGNKGEVCRWGGEEFAVLLKTGEAAAATGEALCAAVRETPIPIQRETLHVTMSVGVSSFAAGTGPDSDRMIRQADRCLYAAKKMGRDRVVAV